MISSRRLEMLSPLFPNTYHTRGPATPEADRPPSGLSVCRLLGRSAPAGCLPIRPNPLACKGTRTPKEDLHPSALHRPRNALLRAGLGSELLARVSRFDNGGAWDLDDPTSGNQQGCSSRA